MSCVSPVISFLIEDELHTLNLTLNDPTSSPSSTVISSGIVPAVNTFTSSWRDRHRRNAVKFRLTDIPCCKRVDSTIHKSKKPFLPPDFRHSNEILKLIKVSATNASVTTRTTVFVSVIKDKQRKLFHINDYDNPTRLKECYVRLCRNLPSYNAEVYMVKEIHGKRSKRKVCPPTLLPLSQ